MHTSVAFSLAVHAVLIVVAIFGLPNPSEFEVEKTEAVPVEILTVSDLTRLQAQSKDAKPTEKIAPEKAEKKPEAPDPKPAVEQKKISALEAEAPSTPAPEPQPAPKPEAVAPTPPPAREEKAKVEDKPEPKPEPKSEPEPKPEAEPRPVETAEPEPEPVKEKKPVVAAKPAPPKPKVKPKPPKRPKKVVKKKKEDEFNPNQISAFLDKSEDTNQREIEAAAGEDGSPTIGDIASNIGGDAKLSADMIARVKQKVKTCWNPPAASTAGGIEKVRIPVMFQLGPDGFLVSLPRVVGGTGKDHPLFSLMAESATRAVRRCVPFDFLPPEKYDDWKDFQLNFSGEDLYN